MNVSMVTRLAPMVGEALKELVLVVVRWLVGKAVQVGVDVASRVVDDAVTFLLGRREQITQDAGVLASRAAGSVVDALVAALGRLQAQLLRSRVPLTVDDVQAAFGRRMLFLVPRAV